MLALSFQETLGTWGTSEAVSQLDPFLLTSAFVQGISRWLQGEMRPWPQLCNW